MTVFRAGAALLLLGCLIGVVPLSMAGKPELVREVLDAMPADPHSNCAYTRVSIEDGAYETERFDPRGSGPRWTLLSLDGEPPGEVVLRRYAEREPYRADRSHPLDLEIRDMVDDDSWRLASDDNGPLVEFEFRLRPHGELTERLVERVRGSLVIDKAARQPIRLRVENTEAANVAPFVRITHYAEDIRFGFDPEMGLSVPVERRTERRGRALGVRSLDRLKTYRYENYACAAP